MCSCDMSEENVTSAPFLSDIVENQTSRVESQYRVSAKLDVEV